MIINEKVSVIGHDKKQLEAHLIAKGYKPRYSGKERVFYIGVKPIKAKKEVVEVIETTKKTKYVGKTTIGERTYVKKHKNDTLSSNWPSGNSMRKYLRHSKLMGERMTLAKIGISPPNKKKFRKGGNNRKNTLRGRVGSNLMPKSNR